MTTVFIDSHNPYPPPYSTKYRVMRDVNTQLSPDFAVYNDAAAWASSHGYCLIPGSMGWNIGGNPPCPITAPSSSPTVSPIVTIGQCEGTPDGVYTFGTCKNGQLVTGYAAPAEQYYVPPSSQPPTTTTTTPPPTPIASKPPPAPYPVEEIAPPTNVWQQDATCPSGFRDYLTGNCKPFTPLPGNEYGTTPTPGTTPSGTTTAIAPYGARYCVDSETIGVWNSEKQAYDVAKCQNPPCKDGYCAQPATGQPGSNTGLYIIGAIALGVVALLFRRK